MRRGLWLVLGVAIFASACGSGDGRQTVVGSVIAVDGDLVSVGSFTVLSDGESLVFSPKGGADFSIPLVHLRDHLRSGDPIRVTFVADGEDLIATDVVDANPHR